MPSPTHQVDAGHVDPCAARSGGPLRLSHRLLLGLSWEAVLEPLDSGKCPDHE